MLDRAAALGVITAADASAGKAEPLPTVRRAFPMLAPQTADRVIRETPRQAAIRLTLDADLQGSLERLAKERAKAIGPEISVAILVADVKTGDVLASVGSAGLFDEKRDGFVDMTRAVRSPGSTLKPFIYGLAFEAGLAHPETLVEDRPTAFAGYTPQNFDKTFQGTVTIRKALEMSLNVPAVQVLEAVGPARLVSRMKRAGVRPKLPDLAPAGLAVGLGGVGLTLRDLVTLYATIARGGQPLPLEERADAIRPAEPAKPLMDQKSAAYVTDILAGTPGAARGDLRLAMKTGTSYGYRDAWAMGYDGRLAIGVWVGRPDGAPMPGLMGVDVAVADPRRCLRPRGRPHPPAAGAGGAVDGLLRGPAAAAPALARLAARSDRARRRTSHRLSTQRSPRRSRRRVRNAVAARLEAAQRKGAVLLVRQRHPDRPRTVRPRIRLCAGRRRFRDAVGGGRGGAGGPGDRVRRVDGGLPFGRCCGQDGGRADPHPFG